MPTMPNISRVRLLAMDVDGTLTDGGIFYDDAGREMKRFHIQDGLGIVLAGFVGLQIAWLTGRNSVIVERRARELATVLTSGWQSPLADEIFAENVFLDRARAARALETRRLLEQAGRVLTVEPLVAENRLRGRFALVGERGRIEVSLQLSPESEPRVQSLELAWVDPRAQK